MITLTDTEVQIRGNELIKHDWYFHNRIPVLINVLCQLREEFSKKSLHIEFSDGEPMVYGGIDHVINLIQNELDLAPNRFVVTTHNHDYQNPRVTVKYVDTGFFKLVGAHFKVDDSVVNADAVMVGAVFGRYTLERFLLASFLATELKHDSFLIFQPKQKHVESELSPFKQYYINELAWNRTRRPHETAADTSHNHNGALMWHESIKDYADIQKCYQIEIVAETDCHNRYFVTEKTAKCLVGGKPFLLFGGCGVLGYLRSLGFRTFAPVIDESYDLEPSVNRRLELVKAEIRRIAGLSDTNRKTMMTELNIIANYNRSNYDRIIGDHSDQSSK